MKKLLLSLSLCIPFVANATEGGQITFLGEVSDATCNLTVNGSNGDATVQLPTIAKSNVGSTASTESADFSFQVSGCSGEQTQVGIRMVPIGPVTTGGNLTNLETSNASNVSVLIKDLDQNKNVVFATGTEQTSALKDFDTDQTFNFSAHYINETGSDATIGKVKAQLQYSSIYQ